MSSINLNSKTCLGFIGLGTLGLPIATNLVNAGFTLKVHTRSRTPEKNKALKDAQTCISPKAAAKDCDVLLVCVSDENAVEEVIFGPHGAINSLKSGATILDLSTISPSKAKLFAEKLIQKNIQYIDAPVTGGTEGAKKGTLTIFLGTDNDSLKKLSFILDAIGSCFYAFGNVGKGQEVKAINQIMVAGSYIAVAEAISLGETLMLPMDQVIEALEKGAGSSWALSNRSQAMLNDNYPLGFKLQLHHKDLSIALQVAEDSGIKLPITAQVKKLEEDLIKKGYKDLDVSVLKRSIRKTSSIKN